LEGSGGDELLIASHSRNRMSSLRA